MFFFKVLAQCPVESGVDSDGVHFFRILKKWYSDPLDYRIERK